MGSLTQCTHTHSDTHAPTYTHCFFTFVICNMKTVSTSQCLILLVFSDYLLVITVTIVIISFLLNNNAFLGGDGWTILLLLPVPVVVVDKSKLFVTNDLWSFLLSYMEVTEDIVHVQVHVTCHSTCMCNMGIPSDSTNM